VVKMQSRNVKLSNASIGMGGALIITIFVVLCLTVFSVLSFVTAYSDLKLAVKTEEMTYDYYKTHGKAEEKLSEIYEKLISTSEKVKEQDKSENFYSSLSASLDEIKDVSIIEDNDTSLKIYYETLGDKNQKICVTLNVLYDEESNRPYYNIESWNLSAIYLPVYEEENYDLWEGIE